MCVCVSMCVCAHTIMEMDVEWEGCEYRSSDMQNAQLEKLKGVEQLFSMFSLISNMLY